MKQFIKALFLMTLTSFALVACQEASQETVNFEDIAERYQERIDAPVNIDSETQFLQMDEAAKKEAYAALDEIMTTQVSSKSALNYSQVENLATEEDYVNFIISTNDEDKILYFGFDECPFCKAFIPKVNQIAYELDLPIYYYNTNEHSQDPTFASVTDTYNFETVPQAFVVSKGKPIKQINHNSSMETIEAFLRSVKEAE